MTARVGRWAEVIGYEATPSARTYEGTGGYLVIHEGQPSALRLGVVAGRLLSNVAIDGLLEGRIPLPIEPRLARILEKMASLGFLRRRLLPLDAELPSVAIVIPAYRRAAMVARCVASVRALDYPAHLIEVVVVDDASDDGDTMARIASDLGARVVTRQVNGGPAAARDSGIRATNSELIALVDSDCVVERSWLMRLVLELSDPAVSAAASRVRTVAGADSISAFESVRSPLDMGAEFGDLDARGPRFFCPTADLVVKRDAYDRCGGFAVELRVGEDVDLCLRLMSQGGRIRYLPEPLAVHQSPRGAFQIASRRYAYGRSESLLWQHHPVTRGGIRMSVPHFAVCMGVMAALGRRPPVLATAAAMGALAVVAVARDRSGGGPPTLARLAEPGFALGRLTSVLTNLSRYHATPLLLAEIGFRRSAPVVAVGCIVGSAMCDYATLRPPVALADYLALHSLEDVAYSSGVTAGALRLSFMAKAARELASSLLSASNSAALVNDRGDDT